MKPGKGYRLFVAGARIDVLHAPTDFQRKKVTSKNGSSVTYNKHLITNHL